MDRSRRRFVLGCAAGAAAFAGCAGASPARENGDDENPNDGSCGALELPLVDEPLHQPERPTPPDSLADEEDWDAQYLGDGMDEFVDKAVDSITVRSHNPVMDPVEYTGSSAYLAEIVTSRESFDERVEPIGNEASNRVESIDFDDEVVVIVTSGFGSSSIRHEWVGVEFACEEIRLHGYYHRPYLTTDDISDRMSAAIVERPEDHDLDRAWASLTVSEDTRVNIPADGDVHVVNGEEDDDGTGQASVERTQRFDVTREYAGDWDRAGSDEIGLVVELTSEDEVRAVVSNHETVERFLDAIDSEEDTAFLIESAGPDTCHNTIAVDEVTVVADDDGYVVQGDATVREEIDAQDGCDERVFYPAALLGVKSDVNTARGTFRITNGWGERETVESISFSELAKE